MELRDTARAAADTIADRLASPDDVRGLDLAQGWWPQSLAHGAAGVALLHIERARSGHGPWQRAHDWLSCAAEGGVASGPDAHLYYGAPALTFALHAAADRPGRYARALDTLDTHVTALIQQRLHSAHARIDSGGQADLAEYDAIRGLSGLGMLLLHRGLHPGLLREVLTYLVRLTEQTKHSGELLPGWWTHVSPSGKPSPDFPEGHANGGVAHGIAGPLALLSLAARRGITVPDHIEAITRILVWLDRWQQSGSAGAWWPYWVTRDQMRKGAPGPGPSRPSWCYGTAGFVRAQQLAALATGDTDRQRAVEVALLRAMNDPGQREATVDVSLCHGFAGLVHITRLVAADALTPGIAGSLPVLLAPLIDGSSGVLVDALCESSDAQDIGLLEGATGVALALHSYATDGPSLSGWASAFLIN